MPDKSELETIVAITTTTFVAYATYRYYSTATKLLKKDNFNLQAEAAHRRMKFFQKIALWCGNQAMRAELEYREAINV